MTLRGGSTPAPSRSDLPKWRFAARAIKPADAVEACISFRRATKLQGEGEIVSQGGEVSPVARLAGDNMKDQTGNECFRFLIPVRIPTHARFIEYEGVG